MAADHSERTCTLEVFRFHPETDEHPRFQTYQVPYHEDWVVLDALNHIKNEIDGSLTYRWSCRMGVCGSCGMLINGTPRLSCAAFLRDYYPRPIRVEPLSHFPVIRDLVINFDDFLHKLQEVKGWLVPREPRSLDDGEYRQTPAQLAQYKQYSMCINCMLCYAACPVYGHNPEFIGPAAIALAQRYNLDSRDGARDERFQVIQSNEGVWECTLVGECSAVCPKNVDPAGAIQGAKLQGAREWWASLLLSWGKSRT